MAGRHSVVMLNRGKKDGLRLMLLDEAFNKMDMTNIIATMRFLEELGLQVFMASPGENLGTLTAFLHRYYDILRDADNNAIFLEGHDVSKQVREQFGEDLPEFNPALVEQEIGRNQTDRARRAYPFGFAVELACISLQSRQISIGIGARILVVVEVEHRNSTGDPAAYRRDLAGKRILGDQPLRHQLVDRDPQRHPGARDGGGAGAAVGLDHVAIERDLPLTQLPEIADRAQGPADKPLNFLCPPALLALGGFTRAAGVRGAREHRIFRRYPAFALAAQPRRQAFLDRGGADHLGVAKADQHRPFGVLGIVRFKADSAHLVGRAAGRSHV